MQQYSQYYTIFTIPNGIAKTPRDNYPFGIISIYEKLCYGRAFCYYSGYDVKASSEHLGQCNTEITSNIYVHIFKEYKAKMAEPIDRGLL